jgi:hypothetical protein
MLKAVFLLVFVKTNLDKTKITNNFNYLSGPIRSIPLTPICPSKYVPFVSLELEVLGIKIVISFYPDFAALHVLCTVFSRCPNKKGVQKAKEVIQLNAFGKYAHVAQSVGIVIRRSALLDRFQNPVSFKPIIRVNMQASRLQGDFIAPIIERQVNSDYYIFKCLLGQIRRRCQRIALISALRWMRSGKQTYLIPAKVT